MDHISSQGLLSLSECNYCKDVVGLAVGEEHLAID